MGLKDKKLSEKLQLDSKLTLEKAVTQTRQSETVKKQQDILQGTQPDPPSASVANRMHFESYLLLSLFPCDLP